MKILETNIGSCTPPTTYTGDWHEYCTPDAPLGYIPVLKPGDPGHPETPWTWPVARRQRNLAAYTWVRDKEPIMDDIKWLRVEDLVGTSFPQPVVLVTGAFDLLHAPHMRLIFEARKKAGSKGTVLVAMNSDASVKALKGPGRPIMSFMERATALSYMPIDVLVEFDTEKELKQIATLTAPYLQVAGPEYFGRPTTAGVPVACITVGGPHTSTIIQRIVDRSKGIVSRSSGAEPRKESL